MLVLPCLKVLAQEQPLYSQYMFNPLVINPAYSGVHDMASAYFNARQKAGGGAEIERNTTTASLRSTLPIDNAGAGLIFSTDKNGFIRKTDVSFSGSYKVDFGESRLLFGLSAGFVHYRSDYTDVNPRDLGDEPIDDLVGNIFNESAPLFGFGMMYAAENMYFGVSTPRLVNSDIKYTTASTFSYSRPILVSAGYILDINSELKLKPSTLIVHEGGATNIDITGSLLFAETLWAGLSYRSVGSMVVLASFQVTDDLKLGASYDWNIGAKRKVIGDTFELMANFNFAIFDVQAVQQVYY
jgi:type IX secretion system PorP/SprF family membrane protein